MNRRLYALHRWISAIAALQLAAWIVSGLFFAVMPAKRVKGAPVDGANLTPLGSEATFLEPSGVLRGLARHGAVTKLELVGTPHGAFYRGKAGDVRFRIDARTGEDRPVGEAEAKGIARLDQPGAPPIREVVLVERNPDVEYRGRPLPPWRVRLADDAGTIVYVDALTGEVTARRNDVWRVYDFLWSLHIMNYRERENFRNPILIGAASLGALTVLTGVVLWGTRFVRWARRKKTAPPSGLLRR